MGTAIKELKEENGEKWINIEDVENVSSERWVVENIYTKINKKLKEFENE